MSKLLPINLFIRQALLYPLTSPFIPPVDKVEENYSYAAGRLTGTLVSGGAGVPFTGQTTQYHPNDDGDYQKGVTITRPIVKGAVGNTRFVDNGDGTITDLATGLMWVKAPNTSLRSMQDSIIYIEGLVFAGHSDWRLPNIKELLSIIDYEIAAPPIDPIFTLGLDSLWTSTTNRNFTNRGWFINLSSDPGMVAKQLKTTTSASIGVRLGAP